MAPIRKSITHLASRFIERAASLDVSGGYKLMLASALASVALVVSQAQAAEPGMIETVAPAQAKVLFENRTAAKTDDQVRNGSAKLIRLAGGTGNDFSQYSMRQFQLEDGTTVWVNKEGKPHDLVLIPAVQYPNGGFEHFENGKLSTEAGSTLAARYPDGREIHLDERGMVTVEPAATRKPSGPTFGF